MTLQVVILAAGRGSRLAPLTDDRPKCMVELHGRPLIEWQLASLRDAGLRDIQVVTGYCAERIAALGLPTIANKRWEDTNIVASFLCARNALTNDRPVIVSYGDIVFEPRVVSALIEAPGDIVTTVDLDWLKLWQLRNDDPLNDAETLRLEKGGVISDIGRKPRSLGEIDAQYIGLTKFTAKGKRALLEFVASSSTPVWPLPKPVDQTHFTDLLRGLIAAGVEVRAAAIHGGWLEVDTPGDLKLYEKQLEAKAYASFFSAAAVPAASS